MELNLTVNGFQQTAVYSDETLKKVLQPLLQRFRKLREEAGRSVIIFLSAPPGAGKSTLGKALERLSDAQEPGFLQCLSIDGFHMTNAALSKLIVARPEGPVRGSEIKGAPETYDVGKLDRKLQLLAEGAENVYFPVYDRPLHEPREDAEAVTAPVILLEGNWLLYEGCGWERLTRYADLTIFLDAEEAELREGLIQRKMRGGRTRAEAEAWFDSTDGPNIRLVKKNKKAADILIRRTGIGALQAEHGLG